MQITVTDLFDGITPESSPITITVVEGSATTGGGGGVTDHGALTGLADDDHTQYHTDARGDARYDALGDADAAQTAAEATAAGALATHAADTTAVHGIADTAALATDAEVATAVSDHAAAANPHPTYLTQAEGDAAYEASGAVATHSADTTAVHGIADTSALETTTGAQTKVDTHVNDTGDAHDASAISFSPTGTIAATDVQAAIAEVASEASGSGFTPTVKTTTYTAVAFDAVLADASGGAFTVTLPAGPATGALVTVKKADSSANAVTIAGTIDGVTNFALVSQFDSITVMYDGSNWRIVNRAVSPVGAAVRVGLGTETTTSTTFVDLATVGPTCVVNIGPSGKAIVAISSFLAPTAAATGRNPVMAFAISGATTRAASENYGLYAYSAGATLVLYRHGATFYVDGLTPGVNTFTAKYKINSGTGEWTDRFMVVTPI